MAKSVKDVDDVLDEGAGPVAPPAPKAKPANPVSVALRETVAGLRLLGGFNDRHAQAEFVKVADYLEGRAKAMEAE